MYCGGSKQRSSLSGMSPTQSPIPSRLGSMSGTTPNYPQAHHDERRNGPPKWPADSPSSASPRGLNPFERRIVPSMSGIEEQPSEELRELEESASISEYTSTSNFSVGQLKEVSDEWKMGLLGE